jgi:hypothetical protein
MKLAFFLQELRGAPLGYSFRLYTYGPYDAQVLTDLKIAESIGLVESEQFEWDGGSGYAFREGPKTLALSDDAAQQMILLNTDIDFIVSEFGNLSAADLEIESTIFYVAKEAQQEGRLLGDDALVKSVKSIKPHHSVSRIEAGLERLRRRNLFPVFGAVAA